MALESLMDEWFVMENPESFISGHGNPAQELDDASQFCPVAPQK